MAKLTVINKFPTGDIVEEAEIEEATMTWDYQAGQVSIEVIATGLRTISIQGRHDA